MDKEQDAEYNQNVFDRQQMQQQIKNLEDDIKSYHDYTDRNRRKYKRYVQSVNVIVSVLYPLTALLIALSFLENLQIWMKILSLLFSAIGTIVPLISRGLAWNEKLQQRMFTYLKLDELMRDMKYEKSFDETSLDRYVKCFKIIVSVDNKMGLNNVAIMEQHSENVMKETGK